MNNFLNNTVEDSIEKTDKLIDYYNFFTTTEGKDMLPYAYLESSNLYDNLILKNDKYYLFTDEVKLIAKNKDVFKHLLADVEEIFEIGPGSPRVIKNKTIPILKCSNNLQRYCIIDYSKNYMFDAYHFLKNKIKDLNIVLYEGDLLKLSKLRFQLKEQSKKKKALMLLGSTIGNFSLEKQKLILDGFAKLLNKGDLIFVTIDTTQNEDILMEAYSNEHALVFVNGVLQHYAKTNLDFMKYLRSFDTCCEWDKNLLSVNYSFKAKEEIIFSHVDGNLIKINASQKLNGIKSCKTGKENFQNLLIKSGFSVVDILGDINGASKVLIFICTRG